MIAYPLKKKKKRKENRERSISLAKITNNNTFGRRVRNISRLTTVHPHYNPGKQNSLVRQNCNHSLTEKKKKKKERKKEKKIFRPRTVEPNFSPPVYGLAEMRVRVYVSITNPAPCKWPFKFTGPSATQGVTSLIELVPVWPAERERETGHV